MEIHKRNYPIVLQALIIYTDELILYKEKLVQVSDEKLTELINQTDRIIKENMQLIRSLKRLTPDFIFGVVDPHKTVKESVAIIKLTLEELYNDLLNDGEEYEIYTGDEVITVNSIEYAHHVIQLVLSYELPLIECYKSDKYQTSEVRKLGEVILQETDVLNLKKWLENILSILDEGW